MRISSASSGFSLKLRHYGLPLLFFLMALLISLLVYALAKTYVVKQVEKRVRDTMLECRAFHHYVQEDMHPAYQSLMKEGRLPDGFFAPELLSSTYIARNFQRHFNEERREAGLPEVRYKIAAVDPRNPVNKADDFERDLIAWFNEDRSRLSYDAVVEEEGEKYLLYAQPFLQVQARCLKCHGAPEDAPKELREAYHWTGAWNLVPGDIVAVEIIRSPLEGEFDVLTALIGGLVLVLGLGALLLFFNNRLRKLVTLRTQELHESEQQYRAVAEDSPVLIFRFLPGGEITYANEAFSNYFQQPIEALIGSSFLDLIPEAEQENILNGLNALRPDAPVQAQEHQVMAPNGELRWQRWTNRAIFKGKKEAVVYQAIAEDIHERKLALEALETEKRRLFAVLNLFPGMVYLQAHDYRIPFANSKFFEAFGEPDDRPCYEIINGRSEACEYCPTFKVFETNQPEQWEWTNANQQTFMIYDEPFPGLDGEAPMVLEMIIDITERKRVELEREQLLHDTGERVKEQVCMYGVAEAIRTRESIEEIFQAILTLIPPGWQYPEITCARIAYDQEEFFLHSFRETPWRLSTEIVISGEVRGAIDVFYREESPPSDEGPFLKEERNLLNGIARALSEAIEHRQAQEQLQQAQKMEAVGQLAGGVAHDFNNLLQAILGYGELALEDIGEENPAYASVEEILNAGERARTLVRQLLAFSRRQVLDMKEVNLNEINSHLVKMIRRLIGEHITLKLFSCQQLGLVRADPGQIEQIILNLCVNARDAMPDGGTITIETENVLVDETYTETHPWVKTGRYVLLSVTDTGCGMDEETCAQIFEPFYTTKGVGEGTGLGLSTVYGLVKQHQGVIHVYSELGKGTTFKIYLPLSERSAVLVGDKINGPTPGGAETILLAEDDEMVRGLSEAFLKNAGYTVLSARDGEEALRLFKAHADRINLALLDVIMPKLGGRAAYEEILKLRPELPVLFSSGYSMNAIHTNFVLDEGLALIQKPFQRDDLLRKVREVLDRKQSPTSGEGVIL